MTWPGEEQAWTRLARLDPEEVQRNAHVIHDKKLLTYTLVCFDQQINISLSDQTISGRSEISHTLIKEFGDFSRLSILNYLVNAREIPPAQNLVRPSDLPGGDIFARGTHVLPLDEIAAQFNNDKTGFLKKGRYLGGKQLGYGDMSVELFPFPRISVVLITWSGDDEFPAKSSLLFDSSCIFHMPIDILWSTAMLTVRMMLYQDNF